MQKIAEIFPVYGGGNAAFERRVGGEIGLAQIFFSAAGIFARFWKMFFQNVRN